MTRPEAIAIARDQIAFAYLQGHGSPATAAVINALDAAIGAVDPTERMIRAFLQGLFDTADDLFRPRQRDYDAEARRAVEEAR